MFVFYTFGVGRREVCSGLIYATDYVYAWYSTTVACTTNIQQLSFLHLLFGGSESHPCLFPIRKRDQE
jgi:hypothetical protein